MAQKKNKTAGDDGKTTRVGVELTPDEYELLGAWARDEKRSLRGQAAWIVTDAIRQWRERRQAQNKR